MPYEFSFDKRSALIVSGCLLLSGALLVFAGFLVGVGSQSAAGTKSSLPVTAVQTSVSSVQKSSTLQHPVSSEKLENSIPSSVSASSRNFCLQYGSFQEKKNAESLIKTLKKDGIAASASVFVDENAKNWYVVRSGNYSSVDAAAKSASEIKKKTNMSVLVRRSDAI